MKTVIIACGSGIATSTMISTRVDTLLDEHHIPHDIIQCSILEIENYESSADLIICFLFRNNEINYYTSKNQYWNYY